MNHTIRTEIDINAPAEQVWSILLDFEHYPDWNPFITRISGIPAVREKLEVRLSLPGRDATRICPKVKTCDENKEFRWVGRPGGIPCVATGEHYFELEQLSDTQTKFHHGERLTGIIVPFMGVIWEEAEGMFHEMNQALKGRAEQ